VRPTLAALEAGVLAGDRAMLARAITLVESRRADDAAEAETLIERLLSHGGRSLRIGISGVPGAGKSTLLEALGGRLVDRGRRVAVLAVDPTSVTSGGSILGDKTRMPRLAGDPRAYVRPSPSARTPGGVARRTREAMVLCEAAGYDVVFVETVGVGQGEVAVADMVDTFVAVLIAGAGDELQGIKRGILELVDLVVVNKADGDGAGRAREAAAELGAALRLSRPRHASWRARALPVSALTGLGLDELWDRIEEHRQALSEAGDLERQRAEQRARWMWSLVEERVLGAVHDRVAADRALTALEADVVAGRAWPARAARAIVDAVTTR
jgi:LAO/AO transport system kinase